MPYHVDYIEAVVSFWWKLYGKIEPVDFFTAIHVVLQYQIILKWIVLA